MTPSNPPAWSWRLVLACLLGAFIGSMSYALFLTEAWAYLSDNPYACANCHVMEERLSSWLASSHHGVAVCNDCHAPRTLRDRRISQARDGIRRGWGFTFGRGRLTNRLHERSSHVLEENCMRCHAELGGQLTPAGGPAAEGLCTHCHRSVGHG